jgi:hypothetical protein
MTHSDLVGLAERRASLCDGCGARGVPTSNTVGRGLRAITYHCSYCGREWSARRLDQVVDDSRDRAE